MCSIPLADCHLMHGVRGAYRTCGRLDLWKVCGGQAPRKCLGRFEGGGKARVMQVWGRTLWTPQLVCNLRHTKLHNCHLDGDCHQSPIVDGIFSGSVAECNIVMSPHNRLSAWIRPSWNRRSNSDVNHDTVMSSATRVLLLRHFIHQLRECTV
jgi:hypothetical protein